MFGVGSALKMDDMPEDVIQSFIKAFSRLSQRVIWQWKGQVRRDLPKNVLAVPWLPQQDLLGKQQQNSVSSFSFQTQFIFKKKILFLQQGHPDCKAFITHGGLNSLQEAIYHAVPVIGMPISTDQSLNVLRAVREGYALKIEWTEVTEEILFNAIQNLIDNPS